MTSSGLPLNLQTVEGREKAKLTGCGCVKDKKLRLTRKNMDQLEPCDKKDNETGS